jgi:hypothetical protein
MTTRKKLSVKVQTSVLGRASPPCEICLQPTSFVRYTDIGSKKVGRFAHIRGVKPKSARHDPDYPLSDLDSPDNLFWCCTDCHDIVDKIEVWTLEKLIENLELNRAKDAGVALLVVEGEINVYGEQVENITGIDAGGKPTVLKPGTQVNVAGKDAKNITGVKN